MYHEFVLELNELTQYNVLQNGSEFLVYTVSNDSL